MLLNEMKVEYDDIVAWCHLIVFYLFILVV